MVRLISFAALAFITTSVQAAPVAPINEPSTCAKYY